jgi:hypothetical protein
MRTSLISTSMLTGGLAAIVAAGQGPAIITSVPYANTLTPLIPDIYAALDVVSREMVGFFPSAARNMGVERAALGQSVKIPVGQVQAAVDIAPAMQVPEPPDNVFTAGSMALTKARAVPFGFTGEEQVALNNGGPGYLSARGMIIAEALRTLVNEVETDLAVEASANASRAYGTPGTTPFTGDQIEDAAQVRKILDDNGAPATGRSLVLNTSAGAKLRSVKNLTRVNEAGTQMTLRQGELLDLYGMSAKESAATVSHTKGTGASATTDNAGYAVGARTITLASAGTGTIVADDTITFAGDTNKYVVVSGDADVSGGGTITIEAPGLRVAIPTATTAITVGASYAANVAFSQNALHVAIRPPAIPAEGDLAVDRMIITDQRSGMSFEIAIYLGYKKVRYEVSAVWGVKAVKPAHIALLLG